VLKAFARLFALTLLLLLLVPASADAHVQGAAEVIAPKHGAWVRTSTTEIVIMGRGNARSTFFVEVDGETVDGKGRRGITVFIPFSLEPGKTLELSVPLAKGGHEIRLRHVVDPDFPLTDPVIRFSVGDPLSPARTWARVGVPLLALIAAAGAVALRITRRRAAAAARVQPRRSPSGATAGSSGEGKRAR
jgi:hypothetical protein